MKKLPLEEVKGKKKETYEKNYVVTMNMNKGQLLGDFQLGIKTAETLDHVYAQNAVVRMTMELKCGK